jgi:uncharacterized repeat protein (TIGR03943 family)
MTMRVARKKKQDYRDPIILAVWALFFVFVLVWPHRLPLYINPKFAVLPFLGALILAAMAFALRQGTAPCGCGHSHGRDWSVMPWFLMPVVMSLIIAPAGLGAVVAGNRQSGLLASTGGDSAISLDLSKQSGYENVNIIELAQAGNIKGGKVSVEGQLLGTAPGLEADECLIAHYQMVCCVADIRPVVVILRYPGGYTPTKGQWVRVNGTAARSTRGVVLTADAIQPIAAPNPPYLY